MIASLAPLAPFSMMVVEDNTDRVAACYSEATASPEKVVRRLQEKDKIGPNSPGTLHEIPRRGQKRVSHAQQLARFINFPGTCTA